jgi:NAD(P)H dehydrogenase (quinone)
MHALIVLAQPEPRSTCARLARHAAECFARRGATVEVSDLYAMQFDPVEGPRHYMDRSHGGYFDTLREQRSAYERGVAPADVAAEMAKLQRADVVLFQFPLWWWGPPAILKGWFDRVFVYGGLHSSARRFERGPLAGRRAMLSVTLGSPAKACGYDGRDGDTRLVLWPVLMTLHYVGLAVLPPMLVHGVSGGSDAAAARALEARLEAAERAIADQIERLERTEVVPFNRQEDFDEELRLRPEARSHTPFIRHHLEFDPAG